jgi:hypothetical protein
MATKRDSQPFEAELRITKLRESFAQPAAAVVSENEPEEDVPP